MYPKFSYMLLLAAQVCEVLPLLEWRAPNVAGWRSCCFGEDTCAISDNSCGKGSSFRDRIACRFNSICHCNSPRMSNSRCRNRLENGQEFQCNLLSPVLTKSGMMDGHSVLENDIGTSKNGVFVCIIRLVHVHF